MLFEQVSSIVRSLRFRLMAWNTGVVILSVVATLIALREGMRLTLISEMDQVLSDDADEMLLALEAHYPDLQQVYEEMNRKARGHIHSGLFVQLLEPSGSVLWSSVNTPPVQHVSFPEQAGNRRFTKGGYRAVQRQTDKITVPAYTVRVGVSTQHIWADISRLSQMMIAVGLALLVIAPAGGYWLAGRATEPLGRTIRVAAGLRPRRLEERLPLHGTGDELDQLARTINSFLDRIAEFIGRNRDFIANAAHELRSPLAAIQSSVEVALNAERSNEEYKELLYDIVDECSRLGTLVNHLLLLAESDTGVMHAQSSPVRLDKLVSKSVDMFRGAAEERGVQLQVTRLVPVTVSGDEARLRQVVNNLIDNGLKFTDAGGTVQVETHTDPNHEQVWLQVTDSGVGIQPEDLPHIFERFFRGDRARNRQEGVASNGLGLSICDAIVESHSGKIKVESPPGGGTRFSVILPAYSPPMSADKPSENAALVG
jgi:heavy metal sensor kinase